MSISNNFNNYHDVSDNTTERTIAYLVQAAGKPYAQLRQAHMVAYQQYFNRMHLDLEITEAAKLPTNQRLERFAQGNDLAQRCIFSMGATC